MKVLIETDKEKFAAYAEIYNKNIYPYVKVFEDEAKKFNHTENLPPSLGRDVFEYAVYLQWPIRKLEYSYMLHSCKNFLESGMKTLDAGCGITPTARWFVSKDCEAYGIDSSEETIEYLKNKNSLLYDPSVDLSAQDLTNLNFENDTFDIITCISVMEHLPLSLSEKAVSELLRVLCPKGLLILTVDFISRGKFHHLQRVMKLAKSKKYNIIFDGLQKKLTPSHGAYTSKTLESELLNPFKKYLVGEMIDTKVDPKNITQFWRQNWWPGCLYEKDAPRDYISVGMNFTK